MAGERRQLKVGEVVVYVDSFKQEHLALTTSVHGTGADTPCGCNLVYVSADESKTDTYGRQVERQTSVCTSA
jgi:hypothetical protein